VLALTSPRLCCCLRKKMSQPILPTEIWEQTTLEMTIDDIVALSLVASDARWHLLQSLITLADVSRSSRHHIFLPICVACGHRGSSSHLSELLPLALAAHEDAADAPHQSHSVQQHSEDAFTQ
jgi:hypothetical protein